jgi:hypothetical protein
MPRALVGNLLQRGCHVLDTVQLLDLVPRDRQYLSRSARQPSQVALTLLRLRPGTKTFRLVSALIPVIRSITLEDMAKCSHACSFDSAPSIFSIGGICPQSITFVEVAASSPVFSSKASIAFAHVVCKKPPDSVARHQNVPGIRKKFPELRSLLPRGEPPGELSTKRSTVPQGLLNHILQAALSIIFPPKHACSQFTSRLFHRASDHSAQGLIAASLTTKRLQIGRTSDHTGSYHALCCED